MQTVSLVLVAMMLALGALLAPVMGAEDHVMVTPNDLNGLMSPRCLQERKWPSSRGLWIKRPLHDPAEIAR